MQQFTPKVGYCTNVHAGATLTEAKANLDRVATAVREALGGEQELPIGLWISQSALSEVRSEADAAGLKEWLAERKLLPYTFNGFPQRDFHQKVVKHDVYRPTWESGERLEYTLSLADLLSWLLPSGSQGSISTLPLGWPHQPWSDEQLERSAKNLKRVAVHLEEIHATTGREIVLAIEPEPGCVLNTCGEMVDFFERYLLCGADASRNQRYLTICHDVCHSSVMFESQKAVLETYLDKGIRVGKVQISSAVRAPWDKLISEDGARQQAWEQLRQFDEPKYLHQTTRKTSATGFEIVEDLGDALQRWEFEGASKGLASEWRVHFHVPIFVAQFGRLETTNADIDEVISVLDNQHGAMINGVPWFHGHLEVETYAWPVLPPELQEKELATGIAKEIEYFEARFKKLVK